jgi:small subunit ribosomal protein S16e
MSEQQIVQTFGRKKNAVAVATATAGKGTIRVNGKALDLIEPRSLRMKVYEPILLVGAEKFKDMLIRVRVRGGGHSN